MLWAPDQAPRHSIRQERPDFGDHPAAEHRPNLGPFASESDRPGRLGGQQLMDGGDGAVVVAQQNQLAPP